MLDKKEKLVMFYLSSVCLDKRTYLISTTTLAEYVSKKYVVSITELNDIMISLCKDNYLDFVVSNSKKGYYYCVNLKNKGLTFKNDLLKEKRAFYFMIFRTVLLSILSFSLGLLLKLIFKG